MTPRAAALLEVLQSPQRDAVEQGLALLESLGDDPIAAELEAALSSIFTRQVAGSWLRLQQSSDSRGAFRSARQIWGWMCGRPGWLGTQLQSAGATRLALSCYDLVSFPPSTGLEALEVLRLEDTSSLEDIGSLAALPRLWSLSISGRARADLAPLACMPGLRELSVRGVDLDDLRLLEGMAGLSLLSLSRGRIGSLAGLERLPLRELTLSGCTGFADLAPLRGLTGLVSLHLKACDDLASVDALAGLDGLERLSLNRLPLLHALPAVGRLERLWSLSLDNLPVEEVDAVGALPALRSLSLRRCEALVRLPVAVGLQHLVLYSCKGVTDLSPLRGAGLRTLELAGLKQVSDFSVLSSCASLTQLTLKSLPGLTDLSALRGLAALAELSCGRCGLRSLDGLPTESLSSLQILRCAQLGSLEGLAAAGALRFLSINWCGGVDDTRFVSSLASLETLLLQSTAIWELGERWDTPALRSVHLSQNRFLEDISGLSGLPSLRLLGIEDCPRLRHAAIRPLADAMPGCKITT